jgi:hypothetical protein
VATASGVPVATTSPPPPPIMALTPTEIYNQKFDKAMGMVLINKIDSEKLWKRIFSLGDKAKAQSDYIESVKGKLSDDTRYAVLSNILWRPSLTENGTALNLLPYKWQLNGLEAGIDLFNNAKLYDASFEMLDLSIKYGTEIAVIHQRVTDVLNMYESYLWYTDWLISLEVPK